MLVTENSRSANKDMTQTSKTSNEKRVPKEMEASVKMIAGESPSCWKSLPPSCNINIVEFLEKDKSFEHLVKQDGLLEDAQEL